MFWNGGRRAALARAYPGIRFRRHTTGLLARFMGAPAECEHLATDQTWMAGLLPDTAYLHGKPQPQRRPARPEASLCRECLRQALGPELQAFRGRTVAFEPNPEDVTQYFFVSKEHFTQAYLQPEVAKALGDRLGALDRMPCERSSCGREATWLWFSRREVASIEESALIVAAPGGTFCAEHGAQQMLEALAVMPRANLEYVNAPYGECGAYVWF